MAENRTEIKQREYLIGDMSEIVGVSRDTLRFYEKKGIIKARKKENGYRYYLEEDLFRLMVILYKRKMNDSLEEIEGYIKGENSVEYSRKGSDGTCRIYEKTSADPYKTGRDEDPLSSAGHCPYAACHKRYSNGRAIRWKMYLEKFSGSLSVRSLRQSPRKSAKMVFPVI